MGIPNLKISEPEHPRMSAKPPCKGWYRDPNLSEIPTQRPQVPTWRFMVLTNQL